MLQKIKNKLAILSAMLMLAAPLAIPAVVSAQDIKTNLNCGSNLDLTGTNCDIQGGDPQTFQDKLADFINIISIIIGVIAVIMIIYGGFRYMTSGGAQEKVTNAKNTIMYALIGLIVVALAQVIVQFVLRTTSGI